MTAATGAVLPGPREPVELRTFAVPEPATGDLVVRVSYGGICGTDLHLQDGHLAIPTPLVLGHEGLGIVHQLGAGVTHDAAGRPLRPGDRVMWASSISCGECRACRVHREPTLCVNRQTCGVNRPVSVEPAISGSWAEYIYLRAGTTVVVLPEATDSLAAMAFACAGPTVMHALERRPVSAGETVVVQGSGPVGLAAAAVAQLSGAASVTILGGPANRLELARRCGIGDHHLDVIEPGDRTRVFESAMELTAGGAGADLVIECAGVPEAVTEGIRLVRRGGDYLVIGQYTDSGDTVFNPHQIVYRQLRILGSWAFTGAHLMSYIDLLPALSERFDLARLVTAFPLAEVKQAMRCVKNGSHLKVVLDAR
ncbi:zinc-binding dehydrogenase [Paractinoplanes durhamensis]|uniref:Alcohol dehydrogenase n=1 Tax=Paractinoplanes durhamensis TaxID=113563 RepID=A0ABQ3ZDF5_9ACTN|nr:zinc-binding dehydrogenase [Actinoplanes durhamensis]GIE07869.1 alcohol dehydrogenase [Actinoplanes durhamensis]